MSIENSSWTDWVPVTFNSLFFILQIIVGVFLLSEVAQVQFLAYGGVALYVFSGMIFGLLPIFEFRKKGGVKKGQSYIQTTKLVDSGIYSIVRHPQYVTFMLFGVAGMLLFQHWAVFLLGVPIMPLTYIDLVKADKDAIEKFGEAYETYMKKVPRMNFLLGFLRLLRKRKEKSRASE